jgi:hypothetical protein
MPSTVSFPTAERQWCLPNCAPAKCYATFSLYPNVDTVPLSRPLPGPAGQRTREAKERIIYPRRPICFR